MIVASILASHLQENMQITPTAHIARKEHQENSSCVEGLVRLTRLTGVASFLVRNIFFVTKSDFFQY